MYMSNSYDLSREFNKQPNPELYNIIDKAYKIVREDNKVEKIDPKDIIRMISVSVITGTINVYEKLQELENNNELIMPKTNNELIMPNTNNILYDIEYVKFIKAKLFSKIIDNVESRDIYNDNLTELRFREHNGLNIKSRLALVNFQSEIIELYNSNGKGAVDWRTLKYPEEEEEGEEGGEEKRGEEKRGGKRSRKSRKTKTAKKSRRTRRRRRN